MGKENLQGLEFIFDHEDVCELVSIEVPKCQDEVFTFVANVTLKNLVCYVGGQNWAERTNNQQ